jgi:hypothetical protein
MDQNDYISVSSKLIGQMEGKDQLCPKLGICQKRFQQEQRERERERESWWPGSKIQTLDKKEMATIKQ